MTPAQTEADWTKLETMTDICCQAADKSKHSESAQIVFRRAKTPIDVHQCALDPVRRRSTTRRNNPRKRWSKHSSQLEQESTGDDVATPVPSIVEQVILRITECLLHSEIKDGTANCVTTFTYVDVDVDVTHGRPVLLRKSFSTGPSLSMTRTLRSRGRRALNSALETVSKLTHKLPHPGLPRNKRHTHAL